MQSIRLTEIKPLFKWQPPSYKRKMNPVSLHLLNICLHTSTSNTNSTIEHLILNSIILLSTR